MARIATTITNNPNPNAHVYLILNVVMSSIFADLKVRKVAMPFPIPYV